MWMGYVESSGWIEILFYTRQNLSNFSFSPCRRHWDTTSAKKEGIFQKLFQEVPTLLFGAKLKCLVRQGGLLVLIE